MEQNHIIGIFSIFLVLAIMILAIRFINKKPFDLLKAERLNKEMDDYMKGKGDFPEAGFPDSFFTARSLFIGFLPSFPYFAIPSPIFSYILSVNGYASLALGVSFFLFIFGLLSSNTLRKHERANNLHVIGWICSLLSIIITLLNEPNQIYWSIIVRELKRF